MGLQILTDIQCSEWDAFVENAPGGTVFHSSAWTGASPHSFLRFGVAENGSLRAGAILQVDECGRGAMGTIAPYLGPLFEAQASEGRDGCLHRVQRLLSEAVCEIVPDARCCSSPWLETPLHAFLISQFQARLLFTTIVEIDSPEAVHSRLAPTLRANLRAAQRCGLQVTQSDDVQALLPLITNTFRRQGHDLWFRWDEVTACQSALRRRGKSRCFYTLAEDGHIVAGVAIVWDHRRSHYLLGGHDHDRSHRGALSLALWEAMRFSRLELGLREFDLEGSHLPAVDRFFRQFRGSLVPYYLLEASSGSPFEGT